MEQIRKHGIPQIMERLVEEENNVSQMEKALGEAEANYRLAVGSYVGVRTLAEEALDGIPVYGDWAYKRFSGGKYGVDGTELPFEMPFWPASKTEPDNPFFYDANYGKYRFLGKTVGDAVMEVLKNEVHPVSVEELDLGVNDPCDWNLFDLVEQLASGGLQTDARAVNASLLNKRGVSKTEQDRYFLEREPTETDASITEELP